MTLSEYFAAQRAHRRARLYELIAIHAGGVAAVFAARFGYTESQLSQYLSETFRDGMTLGEKAARAIEERVGAPFGWLDGVSPAAPANHAAELHAAIAQTRHVFDSEPTAHQALDYLQAVLESNAPGGLLCAPISEVAHIAAGAEPACSGAGAQCSGAAHANTMVADLVLKIGTSQVDAALAKIAELKQALASLVPRGQDPDAEILANLPKGRFLIEVGAGHLDMALEFIESLEG